MMKAKEDGKGHSPMRQRVDDIVDAIIKALVELIDEGGHGPVSPLTMMVSVGSKYTHRLVLLVEHLAVVLWARLRRNDSKSVAVIAMLQFGLICEVPALGMALGWRDEPIFT